MTKCKNYVLNIPRFYRFQTFDHIMFGYVHGLRKVVPTMKVSEAIRIFLDSFEVEEETYCFDTAKQAYYRILNSIVELSESGKSNDELVI